MILYLQTFAPIFTIVLIGPALLILRYALRVGWAGLNVAMLFPALALFIFCSAGFWIGSTSDLKVSFGAAISGLLHGAMMWVSVYLRRPEAVASRTPTV